MYCRKSSRRFFNTKRHETRQTHGPAGASPTAAVQISANFSLYRQDGVFQCHARKSGCFLEATAQACTTPCTAYLPYPHTLGIFHQMLSHTASKRFLYPFLLRINCFYLRPALHPASGLSSPSAHVSRPDSCG